MSRLALILVLVFLGGCKSSETAMNVLLQQSPCFSVASPLAENTASIEAVDSGSVENYVELGLARNPAIAAARHEMEAIKHRIPQALSLPDPMLNTTTHLAEVQTAAGEQAFALGVSQKFTNAERRATQAAMVAEDVATAEATLLQTQLDIAAKIRTACYQLLFVRKSMAITIEDQESLEQISEVVLRQYEVKQSVTQQDVLNIQAELSTIENQLTELKQKEASFQARLARLVHLDPRSQLQIDDPRTIENRGLDVDELMARAIQLRPDLTSQGARIRRDRKSIHLAKLESKPDFTVGLNWIATSSSGVSPVSNGDDALQLGIGFNLPIYQARIQAGICEAQSQRRASESRLASLQDQVTEEVFDLVARIESAQETLSLMQQDIIPKAERTLELSIDEYATDSIDYAQLISNWRSVLRYRLAEANLQAQNQQLMAALTLSVGQLDPVSSNPLNTPLIQPAPESKN